MAKADKQQIDIPSSAASKKTDELFVVHVMPKEFKGKSAALKQALPAPKPVPPPAAPKPPTPAPLAKKTMVQKKGRRSTVVLILIGVIILLLFTVGALFILNSLQDPEPAPDEPIDQPDEPTEPDEPSEPVEPPITQGVDTDSDGLTDVEESLYGTDFRNPDTDGDSFLDGNEVFHRYDPLGYAPSTLLDTGSVEIFVSTNGAYMVYYPQSWRAQESFDPGTSLSESVVFSTRTRSNIRIEAYEKDTAMEFDEWYTQEVDSEINFRSLLTMLSKEGYTGYLTPDKRVTYLDIGEVVYRFTYDLGTDRTIEYLQTFQMMVNSFVLP